MTREVFLLNSAAYTKKIYKKSSSFLKIDKNHKRIVSPHSSSEHLIKQRQNILILISAEALHTNLSSSSLTTSSTQISKSQPLAQHREKTRPQCIFPPSSLAPSLSPLPLSVSTAAAPASAPEQAGATTRPNRSLKSYVTPSGPLIKTLQPSTTRAITSSAWGLIKPLLSPAAPRPTDFPDHSVLTATFTKAASVYGSDPASCNGTRSRDRRRCGAP